MKVCQKSIVRFLVSLIIGTFVISVPFMANAQPDRELRAVWIASVLNIDWPSKKGLPVEEQKQEYIKLLDDVQKMGMMPLLFRLNQDGRCFLSVRLRTLV